LISTGLTKRFSVVAVGFFTSWTCEFSTNFF
jgi:hypothetical protein